MKPRGILGLAFFLGTCISFPALAVTVPHVFSAGDPARAAEVNENFSALETAVNDAGSATFDAYFLRPSSTGALGTRNVIVWKHKLSDFYVARGWFTNTEGITVDVASGTVTPDEIFVWQQLGGDNTAVTYEFEYVYALPAAGFGAAQGISIQEDDTGDGTFETSETFGYKQITRNNSLAAVELSQRTEMYFDPGGDLVLSNNFSLVLSELGEPVTINGMTFNDVAIANFDDGRTRLLARDIGPVAESFGGDPVFPAANRPDPRDVIFYRIEGIGTAGSLVGTPFEAPDVINRWFQ